MNLKKLRNSAVVVALMLLSGFGGWWFAHWELTAEWKNYRPAVRIINKAPAAEKDVDFSLFWDVWKRLERSYIDKKALEPQKMVYGAIEGMTAALNDPYTVFLTPEQNKDSKEDLGGTFEGIGAQLGMKDKKIIVIAPLRGMPAEKAGVKAGDWIIKVNGEETAGWSLPEAVSKIRGPKGTKVILNILHEKEEKPVNMEIARDTILVPSVEWEVKKCQMSNVKCQIIYLKLSRFGDNTNDEWHITISNIKNQISKMRNDEFKGLILDLRNNPGGYLDGSVFIASEFLDGGLVVTQEMADGRKKEYNVNRKGDLTKIPLIVLINKGSASASEIVAGALRDRARAKLVGERSFGKGSVQEAQDLQGGAGLHVTTAKWLLPSGEWINGEGLTPHYEVVDDDAAEPDLQMEKAIEVLISN